MAIKGLKITSSVVTSKGEITNTFISIKSIPASAAGTVTLSLDVFENEAAYDANQPKLLGTFYNGSYVDLVPTLTVQSGNIQSDELYQLLKTKMETDYGWTIELVNV